MIRKEFFVILVFPALIVGAISREAQAATFSFTTLGDLPGGSFSSIVRSVLADGVVVVGSGESALGSEAFVWKALAGMQNVRDVLIHHGVSGPTGWTLTAATGISADRRAGGGVRKKSSGQQEAWIAIAPGPSTLALVAMGLSLIPLVAWRRRRQVVHSVRDRGPTIFTSLP